MGIKNIEFYDENLHLENSEIFFFEALINYMDYMPKFVSLLKMNEIPNESSLLSGNNPDGFSSFDKKKHNYDLLENLAIQLKENFANYKNKFDEFERVILENIKFGNVSLKNKMSKNNDLNNKNNFKAENFISSENKNNLNKSNRLND